MRKKQTMAKAIVFEDKVRGFSGWWISGDEYDQ